MPDFVLNNEFPHDETIPHESLMSEVPVYAQKFVHEAVKCRKEDELLVAPVRRDLLMTKLGEHELAIGATDFLTDLLRDSVAMDEYILQLGNWLNRYWVDPGILVDWIELPLVNVLDGMMSFTDEQLGTLLVNPKLLKRFADTVRTWPKDESGVPDTSFLDGELAG